jgi:hypothetical protein
MEREFFMCSLPLPEGGRAAEAFVGAVQALTHKVIHIGGGNPSRVFKMNDLGRFPDNRLEYFEHYNLRGA